MILKIVIGQPEMEIRIKISVVLDQNTLWIVGGYNGSSLRSTEFIKLSQPSMDPLSKVSAYRILLRTGLNNYKKV